ncbi:DEAD/DEAH box helicase [Paraburkholderia sediminicola]|uniref:helicase-related protein n=1 Tax=Paraburkholderia sediminicola TaxID=458836 RepID=UPI0038B769D6
MEDIEISYSPALNAGRFRRQAATAVAGWSRLSTAAYELSSDALVTDREITLDWAATLNVIREFSPLQKALNFRLVPKGEAEQKIRDFVRDHRALQAVDTSSSLDIAALSSGLAAKGWDFSKRQPTDKQFESLQRLTGWRHGANFSVPGAGKTTVTFALHLLVEDAAPYLLVVAPPNAFLSWKDVASECLNDDAAEEESATFIVLRTGAVISELKTQGFRRFLVSYEMLVSMEQEIAAFMASNPVHLVADESHKLKAGYGSQRGAAMLRIAHLAVRRDILSGTPMPQGPSDVQSQLDFLWPGAGLGSRITRGDKPATVLNGRYVRTNKRDLNLPKKEIHFEDVQMHDAHLALYCIVKDEVLRQGSELRRNASEIMQARRSVIRLLQISANPVAALASMLESAPLAETKALYAAVLEEGPSAKVLRAERIARDLAGTGQKCLIWSIFTQTIEDLSSRLADLNPVVIRGGVASGDTEDPNSREGRIERFRSDTSCMVMVANPAAASEGMSLHMQCHHAVYVDRSFNATHYLQSIDRIHRLGLPPDVETHIHVLRHLVPRGVGSIDMSVSRRLAKKMRALEELLNDPDLHELALDEEESGDGVDYGIEAEDIDDLIREIEGRASDADDEFA